MTTQLDEPIDLGRLTDVSQGEEMHVTRDELCQTLDANRRRGTKRRLSADQHVALALRYKNGEPGAALAREYGVSQGSIAQVVSRVERAADSIVRQHRRQRGRPSAAGARAPAKGVDTAVAAASMATADAGGGRTVAAGPAGAAPKGPARNATAGSDTDIAVGPFLREVFDAVRPMVGPERISPNALRRIAGSLERIAGLMRRRADQMSE